MSNENNISPIQPVELHKLPPFPRFCCSIGMIPSSYKVAMGYEEQLMWLCKYLEETVIPTINENTDATNNVIFAYNQIVDFLNHYFDNLDVQEEINNKLDEMAEDGYFNDILRAYVDDSFIQYFDTINDLKSAELSAGQIVGTKGYYEINDGGKATYIISNDSTLIGNDGNIIELLNGKKAIMLINNMEINLKSFGAYGDNTHDDTIKIQNAIDYFKLTGGKIIIPKGSTFKVNTVQETIEQIDYNYCLKLYSNIELCGGGTIELDSTNTAGDNAIITTLNNEDYTSIYIHDITINGNSNVIETSRHLNNICLFNASNTVIEHINSLNSNYCGIMIRADNINHCLNNRILNNFVDNSKYIGIQVSYNQNVIIQGNTVNNSIDNAIDCYANDSTQYAKTYNTIVSNNNIYKTNKGGIFLESLDKIICQSNNIFCALRGIVLNRINSAVLDSLISNNRIDGGYSIDNTLYGESGIYIANNDYFNLITNNMITDCTNPFNIGQASYNVFSNNNIRNVHGDYIFKLRTTQNNSFMRSRISNNNITDASNSNIHLISPIGVGTSYPQRTSNLIIENNYKLLTASIIPVELYSGVFKLVINSSWNNSVLYSNNETLLNVTRESGTSFAIGDYIFNTRNNSWYKVKALSGQQTTITNVNGESGDYTNDFQTNDLIYKFTPEEYLQVTTD